MITYPNLYHLKYFYDAVELNSISAAAKKNLVSHPAVSRAITSLEKYLELSLIVHQKKSFQVTSEGYKIAKQAKLLLSFASELTTIKDSETIHKFFKIKLGISRSLCEVYLSNLLLMIKKEFPHCKIDIVLGTSQELVTKVAENEIDFCINISSLTYPTLHRKVIKTGRFILIEKNEKYKNNEKIKFENKKFILTEPRYETEKLKNNFQIKFKSKINIEYEISSWSVIVNMVEKGLGIGLVPDILLKTNDFKSLNVIDSNSWFECKYDVAIYYIKKPQFSFAKNEVVQFILNKYNLSS